MPLDGIDRLLAGVAAVIAVYGCLFGIAELLRRWGVGGERTRSLVHGTAAILALGLPYLFGSPWPVAVMAVAFAGSMIVSRRLGLLGSIHDVPRETVGAAMFPLGIAAAYLLTGGRVPGYPIAVLCLGLADPAAAMAGRRWARRYVSIWGTRRSFEGSAVACIVSAATAIVVLQVAGDVGVRSLIPLALVIGVAAALAEATSPLGFDNLAIPAVAAIVVGVADAPWGLAAVAVVLAIVTVSGIARDPSVAIGLARWQGRLP
jgi:phytol kinase